MNKNGFTLIEILVTISIMVLLLATALPSFKTYSAINDLDRNVELISSAITETQTLAMAPPTDKVKDYDGYKIMFDQTGYQIYSGIITKNSTGDVFDLDSSNQVLYKSEKISLTNKINVSGSPYIIYSVVGQGKIIYPKTNVVLPIQNQSIIKNNIKTISINVFTGQVEVK
jgi:prepilin-type N-terminal cleavage/methylation domain-containing protein